MSPHPLKYPTAMGGHERSGNARQTGVKYPDSKHTPASAASGEFPVRQLSEFSNCS
jgi:hypothetical protein